MNLYLRVLIVLFRAWCGERITDITKPFCVRLRVYPNDLDSNLHMNNGRYLTVMDLGRLNLILRTGLWRLITKKKYAPVLAAAQIRYRLPLMPFHLFDLETHVLCWDEKWIFMEQRFLHVKGPKAGVVAAIALVKGSFYDPECKATVPTSEILDAMGHNQDSPSMPAYLADWIHAEDALRDVTA
jgi:acyl-CoA thioesterase FadM